MNVKESNKKIKLNKIFLFKHTKNDNDVDKTECCNTTHKRRKTKR